jgi:hypothetical protein
VNFIKNGNILYVFTVIDYLNFTLKWPDNEFKALVRGGFYMSR